VSVDPTVPLRPQLQRLEEKLQDSIEEVCEAPPVGQVNTGELIRMEESLAIAAEAAKEAVSIRRKLRDDVRRAEPEASPEPPPASQQAAQPTLQQAAQPTPQHAAQPAPQPEP
jgi:hypothetical protein